jgi:hypothetical protein
LLGKPRNLAQELPITSDGYIVVAAQAALKILKTLASLSAAAASSETLLNPPIGAVSLTCERATSDLRLAIDNAQQCAHGAVEFASPLLVGLHRPRRNPEKALELLSRGCNL